MPLLGQWHFGFPQSFEDANFAVLEQSPAQSEGLLLVLCSFEADDCETLSNFRLLIADESDSFQLSTLAEEFLELFVVRI